MAFITYDVGINDINVAAMQCRATSGMRLLISQCLIGYRTKITDIESLSFIETIEERAKIFFLMKLLKEAMSHIEKCEGDNFLSSS